MIIHNTEAPPKYLDMLRLDGQNILVIGAGQGIGRQASHALAQAGANVACVDIDDELAKRVGREVGGIAWAGDVTRSSEVDRLAADVIIDAFGGRIDGLVDIVGMATWATALETTESAWDDQFDVCLRHAFLLGRSVGRQLVQGQSGGSMVFLSSLHGLTASPRHSAYGAAKAALISWVKTLASELGVHGIRVNAIAPGSILTPRTLSTGSTPTREKAAELAPLRRNGTPADVAGTTLFLMSDLAAFVTGQTIAVDGGVSIADPFERL